MASPSERFSRAGSHDDRFSALLAAAKNRDPAAVEELFRDLQPRLLRFLRGLEPKAADDIAADVWVAIARGIQGFEGDASAWRGWVFTIARRRLADHRRAAGRRRSDPFAEVPDTPAAHAPNAATPVIDAASAQEAVDLIVRSLPADQAEVVLLRVLAGLDVAEVANITGRTANWVRVAQHRAFRRLATILRPSDHAAEENSPDM